MLLPKSDPRWLKLITGEIDYNFQNVAMGLMLSRLKRQLTSSFGPVESGKCVDELYGFACKYETLLADDFRAIFG
jgi:hypothetical protein